MCAAKKTYSPASIDLEILKRIHDHLSLDEDLTFLLGIMDSLPTAICIMDDRERLVYANIAFSSLIEKPRRTIINKPVSEVLDQNQAHILLSDNSKIFSSGISTETCSVLPSGTDEKVLSITKTRLINHKGDPLILTLIENITGQTQVQDALKKERDTYRNFFSSSTIATVLIDDQQSILSGNSAFWELIESDPEENLEGAFLKDFMDSSTLSFLEENNEIETTLGSGERRRTVLISLNQIPGSAIRSVSFLDITRRKVIESALRSSEKKFRNIIESLPIGMLMYQLNKEGELIFMGANPEADTILGMDTRHYVGQPIEDVFPGLSEIGIPEIYKLVASNGMTWSSESIPYQKDGSKRWYEVHAFQTSPEMMVAAFSDVTERKWTEESRNRLAAAVEQAGEAIVITNSQGEIIYVNPAFEKISGYADSEVSGRSISFLTAGTGNNTGFQMKGRIVDGKVWSGRLINKAKDGSTYEAEATLSPIYDDCGRIANYVVLLRDVTREAQLERDLRQTQKMEALGTLAGGIAHDFNNLLQIISGNVQLMLDDDSHQKSKARHLQEIENTTTRAAELVQRLLTFSRKTEVKFQDVDLNDVLLDSLKLLRRTIPRMVSIETSFGKDLGLIHADLTQLEQVIINLAGNASDAMPQGGKLRIATRTVLLDAKSAAKMNGLGPGKYIALEVTDEGVGMDRETRRHIFEPFYTTKEIGKGTGLGLSIVYGIVTGHKGQITCRSKPGQGTTFSLYFPAVGKKQKHEPIKTDPCSSLEQCTGTILLVDDEQMIIEVVKTLLSQTGFSILTASSGEEALEVYAAAKDEIDLVILDLGMPGMGGEKCLVKLHELNPSAKIIIASGYSPNELNADPVQLGASAFLHKPYRLEVLLQTISDVLKK